MTTFPGYSPLVRRFVEFQIVFPGNPPDNELLCRRWPSPLSVPAFPVLSGNLEYNKTVGNPQEFEAARAKGSLCANQIGENSLIDATTNLAMQLPYFCQYVEFHDSTSLRNPAG